MQALFDLEATNNELKADLRDLYITAAKEVDVANSARKAIIVHVSSLLLQERQHGAAKSVAVAAVAHVTAVRSCRFLAKAWSSGSSQEQWRFNCSE